MLTIADEDLPEGWFNSFAVRHDGTIVYRRAEDSRPLLVVIDSTGRRIGSIGVPGEGPGELRSPLGITIAGDTIRVVDASRMMLVELDFRGKPLRDRQLRTGGVPLAWVSDSFDSWRETGGAAGTKVVQRIPIGLDGAARRLIGDEDSVMAAAIEPRHGTPPLILPYTATDDRILVGDGWSYRVRVFTPHGEPLYTIHRDLPANRRGPRQMARLRESIERQPRYQRGPNGEAIELPNRRGRLDTLEREAIAHFGRFALHVDAFDRLWVIGVARDSTTIDVFRDSTFLGRETVPCLAGRVGYRAALASGWLLLECEVDQGDWPTELQLYRVIED